MFISDFYVLVIKGIMEMFGSGLAYIPLSIFHSFKSDQSIPSTPIPLLSK
jgi:hypothetical protein